ncbi:MAG: peptidylprolyl isomerase [Actinomycetota bacterium]
MSSSPASTTPQCWKRRAGTSASICLEEQAPITVNNFVFLAREGSFDGLVWHRVVQRFVIQTGDPDGLNGHAPDDAGYSIPDELAGTEGRDYVFGVVAMANTGQPGTGGRQFFIVVQPEGSAGLDPLYTIFGQAQGAADAARDQRERHRGRIRPADHGRAPGTGATSTR